MSPYTYPALIPADRLQALRQLVPYAKLYYEEKIIRVVAEVFGIAADSITGRASTATATEARDAAIIMYRTYTGKTLREIGAMVGGRDHSTILSAIDRGYKKLMKPNSPYAAQLKKVCNIMNMNFDKINARQRIG